jgi:hypothetical protein
MVDVGVARGLDDAQGGDVSPIYSIRGVLWYPFGAKRVWAAAE